ncbi:hypothetical protein HN385_00740 [archaeon]|jgi:proteasome lid subunit RPN8/RPN11|nr:hypothetical protein [archaeon]MBT3450924.1 hypothetical protein [archaeon]MBT6869570.1 hypothetical protein [archaeon]MBT7193438.1 hypothetical protein [archaeon]MBT7381029.1 hypothetical protein [archaeon]
MQKISPENINKKTNRSLNEEQIIDIDSLNQPTFRETHPKIHKTIIISSSLFMALLMISFVFATFPIDSIIKSYFESSPLEGNVIDTEEFKVYFLNETENDLQEWYIAEQKYEFSACLLGYKINEDYYITSAYQPEMYEQTFNHVNFESCSQETKIMLHTHPYKSCIASDTDLNTLNQTRQSNPEVIMLIMCEPDRFSVY